MDEKQQRITQIDAENSTARLEAFSDGVFAIALTLLVLDLKVPKEADVHVVSLRHALAVQWPVYAAYVVSFLTILVMWINHHRIFRVIRKSDHALLVLNGILLMFVSVVPFSTSLLAEHIRGESAVLAALLYCLAFECVSLAFYVMWHYGRLRGRLFNKGHSDMQLAHVIDKQYRFGPYLYLAAAAACFVSPWLGFGLCSALAVFFALPAPPQRPRT